MLACGFTVAGVLHFVAPEAYMEIMPPFLPWHRELVLASGAAEIAGGAGLLHPRTRRAAGAGLVLLLLAVWPANLQMALEAAASGASPTRQALLWLRLPLQLPLMLWVAWASARPRGPPTGTVASAGAARSPPSPE